MVNLEILKQLVNDRELRGQAARVLTSKVRADFKSFETNALLSRRLLEVAAFAQRGETAPQGASLRELIKEHLDFYESLVNQTLAFNQRLNERLQQLGAAAREPDSALTLQLTAARHSMVRAPFTIENNRTKPIEVDFEIAPFCNEKGTDMVSAEVTFDPPRVQLKPGQEARIVMIVEVTDAFTPEEVYLATLSVKGLNGTQLLVRLHVTGGNISQTAATSGATATPRPEETRASAASVHEKPPRRAASKRPARKASRKRK